MTIKELPLQDRPYEKLFKNGAEALSDTELLAIILNSGTKNKTVLEISQEIMSKDEENIGLTFLTQYSIEELMKIEGIGKVKAVLIQAVCEFSRRCMLSKPSPKERINDPIKLSRVFMLDLSNQSQEVIKTAILDSKNRVIKVVTNSIGTVNSNSIGIKELLIAPIRIGAPKIAIAHNHPSR